eukprot:jgi/Picsp_1/5145/NSC_02508-R1_protein
MLSVCDTVQLTDRAGEQHYVLHLVYLYDSEHVVATLSTGGFKSLALGNGSLRAVGRSTGRHEGLITDAQAVLGSPTLIQTSSTDGFVRTWDMRTHASVESYTKGLGKAVCSCTSNLNLVAAGIGEQLVLWDRRTRKIIASFEDTHAQDIIQIKFNPSFQNAIISGSEDGSLAVFDVSQVIDEEDSFVGALSINTSVSKIGFYGNEMSSLWCTSGTESVHWWDWKQSCDPESMGGAGVTAEALEPRQNLFVGSHPSDYLISCHYSDMEDSMFTLVGDIHGSAAVYTSFNPQGTTQVAFSSQPLHLLTGGHKDIVRAVIPCTDSMQFRKDTERCPILLSGGEDGRICLWAPGISGWSEAQAHHRQNRASPY